MKALIAIRVEAELDTKVDVLPEPEIDPFTKRLVNRDEVEKEQDRISKQRTQAAKDAEKLGSSLAKKLDSKIVEVVVEEVMDS